MPRKRMIGKNSEKGFTLVELLIVMTVILVLMGLCMVGYRPFVAKAKVTKAASAASCLRSGLTGFSEWSPQQQTAVFNGLGSAGGTFYQTAEDLGCSIGPTAFSSQLKASLSSTEICLIVIELPDGTKIKIGCISFDAATLPPGAAVVGYQMGFQVPEVRTTSVDLTERGVSIRPSNVAPTFP